VPQPGALPPRNVSAPPGPQFATLPPSARPQDEYDMAYGYVLHKDYTLAEQAFRDFIKKHPEERLVPDAQYWLGEALFQQQRYRDAAESFLAVSTKYEQSGKAPDSLLRLGQSLAAMKQKEAACATLAEVGRKYPRASASVKRGVATEQKRVHC
jgi:tol-pal system protein YbgF